jgi:hypothetical protein
MAFLDHLERQRHNSVRSRNARLAALRSFLKFAGAPGCVIAAGDRACLGVPVKAFRAPDVRLSVPGGDAGGDRDAGWNVVEPAGSCLVAADVQHRRAGFRDHRRQGRRCGARRQRRLCSSARQGAQAAQRAVVAVDREGDARLVAAKSAVRFGTRHCCRIAMAKRCRDPTWQRLVAGSPAAVQILPDLATRTSRPHTIRHTTAMHLLQAGVDISVIALWLGHESPATTHHYVEADLAMKERALARLHEPEPSSALSGARLFDRLPADALIMWSQNTRMPPQIGRLAHVSTVAAQHNRGIYIIGLMWSST